MFGITLNYYNIDLLPVFLQRQYREMTFFAHFNLFGKKIKDLIFLDFLSHINLDRAIVHDF
jgi:hypothetical protein